MNMADHTSTMLAANLRRLRERRKLTQQDLAKRLKKHQSFVAKYEGGERRIDVVEFLAITRAIGADPVGILKALRKRA